MSSFAQRQPRLLLPRSSRSLLNERGELPSSSIYFILTISGAEKTDFLGYDKVLPAEGSATDPALVHPHPCSGYVYPLLTYLTYWHFPLPRASEARGQMQEARTRDKPSPPGILHLASCIRHLYPASCFMLLASHITLPVFPSPTPPARPPSQAL